MLLFKTKTTILQFIALAIFTCTFVACEDDQESVNGHGDYAITMAYAPSDGSYNYTYRTVQYESLMDGTLNNVDAGTEQLGYFTYTKIGNTIFSPGGLDLTSLETIQRDENNDLYLTEGTYSFSNSIIDLVKASSSTAVAAEMSTTSDIVRLHLINTTDASISTTVDTPVSSLSSYSSPAYSGMVVSGDYLYLSFYISNPTNYATSYTDQAEVAVFSYPGLEFVKVISDDRTGPIGGFNTMSGLMKDDEGNIYATSHTNPGNGYSQYNQNIGLLKINAGETEFDQDYFFDFNADGDGNTTAHLMYLGDNKTLALMNTLDRSEQTTWYDEPLKPAILDLSEKTINYIEDVPEFAGTGRKLTSIALQENNYVYLPISEEDGIYMYRINTEDYSATKGALLECNFVAGVYAF